ncbi:MAG: sugar ABC transporter substrate-binding protein [Gemmatimonadaceae bacterium]
MRGRLTFGIAALASVAVLACARKPNDGAVQLRLWALGREGELVQALTRDFERENPRIRVDVQQIPWNAAHEKLLTGFVGETSPDVAQLGNTWVPEFDALHSLLPLDSLVASSETIHQKDFFPGIWDTNVLNGVTYGIPWYVDTRVIFYRKDLLKRAGVDSMPTTWRAWRTAMEKVRDSSGGKYAIFLPLNEWNQPVIFGMQAGSSLLKDNGTRGAFSDSTFRRAFDFYIEMFRDKLAPPLGAQQMSNLYQEMGRGLFAMYISGPWQLGEFANRLPPELQDQWATAPLPGPTGDTSGVSMAGGSSIVVFKSSPHRREAWKLVEYLSRPAVQAQFYHLSGDLPPTYEAWRDTALANNPRALAFKTQLERVRPLPKVPEWEQVAQKTLEYAERAIRGQMSNEATLRALDVEVDKILEKRRWMLNRGKVSSAARAGEGRPTAGGR